MSQLSYVLQSENSPDNLARSGEETYKLSNNIKIIEGKYGSIRLQKLNSEGNPICGIHLIDYNDKHIVATIYTHEEQRRLGHASELLNYAMKNYKNVTISEDKTQDGKMFFGSVKKASSESIVKPKNELDLCSESFIAIHTTTSESNVRNILSKGFDLRKAGKTDRLHAMPSMVESTPYAIFASPVLKHSFIEGIPYVKIQVKDKARVLTYNEDSPSFKRKLFEQYDAKDRRDLTQKLKKAGIDVICNINGDDEMIILNKKSISILEGGLYNKTVMKPQLSKREYSV